MFTIFDWRRGNPLQNVLRSWFNPLVDVPVLQGDWRTTIKASLMPNMLEKGAPFPVSLGRCADLLHDVRDLRLSMQKQVDAIKARENEIEEHLVNSFSPENPGAVGLAYVAKLEVERVSTIEDWGVFCSWVRKHDRFDCIQKRLASKAVDEVQTAEKRVLPGLQVLNRKWVSLNKR